MKDLTKGNPAKLMLQFAIPVCLGNLFQLFYSLADTRIVGSALGETALAAVGATTAISTLLVGFLQGLSNGFAVVAAQNVGTGSMKQLKKTAAGTLFLGSIITIFLTLVSLLCLPLILKLMNIPENLYGQANGYIRIILLGLMVTMLYNACAGILRAVGDTVAPLLFLMCASILNIGLDLLLMVVIPLGVAGAALGTVLAQAVSVVLSLVYIWKRYPVFHLQREDFRLEKSKIRQMLSSGLSMGMMMSLVFFGTLSLQCAINTLGTDTIVAHTAARKISELYFMPITVMGLTIATFCGQNYGAGKFDRVRQGLKNAMLITWGWTLLVILMSYTIAPQLIYLVSGSRSTAVLTPAVLYLKVNSLFYFLVSVISIFRNTLQAMGDHIIPVFSSAIELVGKIIIAMLLTPVLKYMGIIIAEPLIWCLMVIPLIVKLLTNPNLKKTQ
ncbi:MAG: MATE family efflux transporter [Butyricicoccaceae bacterium]